MVLGCIDASSCENWLSFQLFFFCAARMKQSHWKPRKVENTKRTISPLFNYGERLKNSVVCGVAGLEFAQELWQWSSVAALYAWAKRLKVSCKLFWSLFWDAVDFCRGSERNASGVQQEPEKLMRHCPNKDRWRRLAVHLECWVTKTSIMCSACVGLRFCKILQIFLQN